MFKKKKMKEELNGIIREHKAKQIKLGNYIKEHDIHKNTEEMAIALQMEEEVNQLAQRLVNLDKLIYGKKSRFG